MSNIHRPSSHAKVVGLAAGTLTTGNSASVDCLGYQRALFINLGTTGVSSTLDALVQEASDNATFANVASSNAAEIVQSTTNGISIIDVDLTKRQRYLRIAHTDVGTVNGGILVLLFNADYGPVAQTLTPTLV